jgi:hypothetical protein
MDEKYLSLFTDSNDLGTFAKWAGYTLNTDPIYANPDNDFLFNDDDDYRKVEDKLREMAVRMLRDNEAKESSLEKLIKKKELSVAETLDLYNRGLKPYFVTGDPDTLVELVLENENTRVTPIKWLHPKIAEKIQTRYKEMNDLVIEKEAAIESYDNRIEELKKRIGTIEESGTDLIL